MARNEETHQASGYFESLPDDLTGVPVLVLDPMLATGGSMKYTVGLLLRARGDRYHGVVRGGGAGRHCRA